MAKNRTLIGSDGLDRLKFEVAGELVPQIRQNPQARVDANAGGGFSQRGFGRPVSKQDFDALKFELAQELGVPYQPGYNGELLARDAGRLGGKIGGNMVRRLIQMAEQSLAGPPN